MNLNKITCGIASFMIWNRFVAYSKSLVKHTLKT